MKALSLTLLLLCALVLSQAKYIRAPGPHDGVVKSKKPDATNLPSSWDIRDVPGLGNLASVDRNQHVPVYCGSCWAHGALSALADRFALNRRNRFPEVMLSVQDMIACSDAGSCSGGDPYSVYEFGYENGFVDETCNPYVADDTKCPDHRCYTCDPKTGCHSVKPNRHYHIEEYGEVSGEEDMRAEVSKRGPIACTMGVTKAFLNYTTGVFREEGGEVLGGHAVSLVGYKDDYWIFRNSWGTAWGEDGYFRVERGRNLLQLESACYWAIPRLDFAPKMHDSYLS